MIISIDLSLRSTGAVAIDDEKNLIDFALVKSCNKPCKYAEVFNGEELISYNTKRIMEFIEKKSMNSIDAILIEGLSFGSLSGSKDILAGNFWYLRVRLKERFPGVPIHIIPVQTWRNKILSKQDREIAKGLYGKKWAKQAVVEKLPKRKVKERFLEHIKAHGYCKDSLFDLADAYGIGIYWVDYGQDCIN